LIAFIAFGVWAILGTPQDGVGQVVSIAFSVNIGFFVFNMIPIPPLDGSRVLYALAPEFVRRGMEAIERFGIFFVFVIVLLAGSVISMFMGTAIQFFEEIFAYVFGLR
jgi:Zn-dependent protease